MRQRYFFSALLLLLMVASSSCNDKKTDWSVSLDHTKKTPYGTFLAFETLKHYFPGANVSVLSKWFRYSNIDDSMRSTYYGKSALVLEGLDFYASESEIEQLTQYVRDGNELVLFCSRMDNQVEELLHVRKAYTTEETEKLSESNTGKENQKLLTLLTSDTTHKYGYIGRSLEGFFELDSSALGLDKVFDTSSYFADANKMADEAIEVEDSVAIDSVENYNNESTYVNDGYEEEEDEDEVTAGAPEVLGRTTRGPDFIRYAYGAGHITIHAAPLVLSNYFVLQPENRQYLDGIWRSLPSDINRIYWQEYYRRRAGDADSSVLWRHPATRWAFIIALLTLLLYVLFEVKRRQRIIPIINPQANTSVSFVETIGRLYYNKGDHVNLAEKMVQHFLEHVRIKYLLSTSRLDESFIHSLTGKSGKPETEVRNIVEMANEIRNRSAVVDDAYLFSLQRSLQSFY